MIENKWKRFAISQVLSDWGNIDSSDLFDCMMIEDETGLEELFERWDVVVWQPFEGYDQIYVASVIENIAKSAQETAND